MKHTNLLSIYYLKNKHENINITLLLVTSVVNKMRLKINTIMCLRIARLPERHKKTKFYGEFCVSVGALKTCIHMHREGTTNKILTLFY